MASTRISRTFSQTATSTKKGTFSCWFKRGTLGGEHDIIASPNGGNGGGNRSFIRIDSNNNIDFRINNSTNANITDMEFKDVNAWYHIVLAIDLTQSAGADRLKFYVNGNLITSFSSDNYPSGSLDICWGQNNVLTDIGYDTTDGGAGYFDGSMSHMHWIDGTQYAASDFGSTDSTTGEWKINPGPNVTYGNNGFFILKDGNSLTDQSGNSNNFTLASGTLTKTEDCPSNVFATLNPLIINNFTLPNMTYVATTEGNNTLNGTSAANNGNGYATLGASSGKFYCEVKITANQNNYPYLGIMPEEGLSPTSSSIYGLVGYNFTDTVSYEPNGNKRINGSTSSFGDTYGLNDIIGIAMDLDNGAVYYSKNGTFQNSGNPTSGASKTGAALTFTANDKNYFLGGSTYNAGQIKFNFGNGYFGTTYISSAGTNASGIGIFEYDVPAGFTALSTKGLNE